MAPMKTKNGYITSTKEEMYLNFSLGSLIMLSMRL